MELVMILCFLGLALALQGSTAPSPSTLDVDSLMQALSSPVSAPSVAVEPNENFNTDSHALSPSPSIVGKGIGTPVVAPADGRRDPIPPVNESPRQDPYISPTAAPTQITVGKGEGMPSAAPPSSIPGAKPPTSHSPTKEPDWSPLPTPPLAPIPVAVSPTKVFEPPRPVNRHPEPGTSPSSNSPSITWEKGAMPVAAPPSKRPEPPHNSPIKEPNISPASNPPPSAHWKSSEIPVASPPSRGLDPHRPANTYPIKAPSPSTLTTNSSVQVPPGPVSGPISAFEPNVNFNNTGSPSLSPSPSIVMKGIGTPAAAPGTERHDQIPPMNDSPPRDSYISPTSSPIPSLVGKGEGVPSAAPPVSIPGGKHPTTHAPTKEPDIPSVFTPPPSIVSERDGVPAAAPQSERPEPVLPVEKPPIREPAWSPLSSPPPAPIPVATPPTKRLQPLRPVNYHPEPGISPTSNSTPDITWKRGAMPVAAPSSKRPEPRRPMHSSPIKEPDISPASTPPPSINWKRDEIPVAAPSYRRLDPQRPAKIISPIKAPSRSTWKGNSMPVAAPPSKRLEQQRPVSHIPYTGAGISPASNPPPSIGGRRHVMPSAAPVSIGPKHHSPTIDPDVSPASTPSPSIGQRRENLPDAGSSNEHPKPPTPYNHPPIKGSILAVAPSNHKSPDHHIMAPNPSLPSSKRPSNNGHHVSASPSSIPFYKHHHTRNNSAAPVLSHGVPPVSVEREAGISPDHAPGPLKPGSSVNPSQPPITSTTSDVSPSPSPPPEASSDHSKIPVHPPKGNRSGALSRTPKPLPAVLALPPPPPNSDCSSMTCTEPYTNPPPGSPCACVLPMQVGLRLGVDLYTFFPLVSELAAEVSAGIFMKQSQVRIMGANTASQQLEKTIVLIDLVPLGKKFDGNTAFFTFERFWHKQVPIKASFFGGYEVLYVRYPGLPSSPPVAPSDITIVDGGPYSGSAGGTYKPLGVDVQKMHQQKGLSGGVIAIIVLSTTVAVLLLSAAALVFMFRQRDHVSQQAESARALPSSLAKSSGALGSLNRSGPSSASLSIESSIAPYTGSAKTLSANDIEKATDNYNPSRILGEGGFGLVYRGILEDGTEVAVKVLKRDDQQGSREFLAEIEMLSRLHHRNLVKLIGICIEERARCLVYELIRNGSVESHLHGVDKETSPLDWAARIKIALGAARGLAYLHEDSSPRVIHRDFKATNILLEEDFTPKVSDFGLARTAMDEENRHISTRVMGTFGYVAPEYAMTGHLLVKSDVYSYGVVLLELLTGKKPVDMSQAPGQESLVAWARPLLTNHENLETIVDPALGSDIPFDSISKVAAIASMCVQPEVSNRPFMGEVVQALKLVCNECEESYDVDSRTSECEDLSIDMEGSMSVRSEQLSKHLHRQFSHSTFDPGFDPEHGLSVSDFTSTSARLGGQEHGSFRRNSSSGPMRTGGSRQFWQSVRLYGGSVSEHGTLSKFWRGSR